MKKIIYIFIIALITILPLSAQYSGQWGMHVEGNASLAVGELREWFNIGYQVELGIGQQQDSPWFIEGIVDYSSFSRMHYVTTSTGVPVEGIPLSLWYIGFLAQGKYRLNEGIFQPYLNIAAGPHYWVGSRGTISANTELGIPSIPEKMLNEWNMGLKAGLGIEFILSDAFSLDAGVNYRLVIGSLWPTMQEHVELEAVNGFSSLSLRIRTNIYF
ncbi:MAG: outer membrane beta-barrel protein [Candidatus Marinimicrobia bacterium]|nr:outer membrane beta-barrel protein [Candidatus Neomarinimicrobiota bacterium]